MCFFFCCQWRCGGWARGRGQSKGTDILRRSPPVVISALVFIVFAFFRTFDSPVFVLGAYIPWIRFWYYLVASDTGWYILPRLVGTVPLRLLVLRLFILLTLGGMYNFLAHRGFYLLRSPV